MDQALNGVLSRGESPQLWSSLLLQLWNRIIVRSVCSWVESTRLCHNTALAAVGCDGAVPGLSSRAFGANSEYAYLTRIG